MKNSIYLISLIAFCTVLVGCNKQFSECMDSSKMKNLRAQGVDRGGTHGIDGVDRGGNPTIEGIDRGGDQDEDLDIEPTVRDCLLKASTDFNQDDI